MQPETYILLHRMLEAATTRDELEIVLRRFQEVIYANKDSADQSGLFDAAWAASCAAGLYLRLNEFFLAERTYMEAIKLFDENNMAANSAVLSITLAEIFLRQGRVTEAETQLKENIKYTAKYWGEPSHYVNSAKEELRHFQQTGEIIEAINHIWCKPCGVDKYSVGFDEDTMHAPEVDDI